MPFSTHAQQENNRLCLDSFFCRLFLFLKNDQTIFDTVHNSEKVVIQYNRHVFEHFLLFFSSFFMLLWPYGSSHYSLRGVNAAIMQVCKGTQEVNLAVKWIQWAARSLNLAGACGVNCSKEANISDWSNQYSTSTLSPLWHWKCVPDGLEANRSRCIEPLKSPSHQQDCLHRKTRLFTWNIQTVREHIIQVRSRMILRALINLI